MVDGPHQPALDDVESLRRFNRTYTQRIGVLEDSFLGLGMPLGTARMLFEIGTDPDGVTIRDLRVRLGLDSGYVSRVLADLEDRGLVETAPDPVDRRRRIARSTLEGVAVRRRLDDRSHGLASVLLEPLTRRQRTRLVEALATADLLVRAATVDLSEISARDPLAIEAVDHYLAELDARFPGGFDIEAAREDDRRTSESEHGRFVLARSDGRPVACGGVRTIGPGVAEIKRMWVDAAWRGAGLGSRLLRHLEAMATESDHTVVRLDTNRTLTDALGLYERAGYNEIPRYNDNPYAQAWFEKALTGR